MNFWDLGGQTDLQSIWSSYYTECHGIVFMVDSTDRDRMSEVQQVFGWFSLLCVNVYILITSYDII